MDADDLTANGEATLDPKWEEERKARDAFETRALALSHATDIVAAHARAGLGYQGVKAVALAETFEKYLKG